MLKDTEDPRSSLFLASCEKKVFRFVTQRTVKFSEDSAILRRAPVVS